MDYEKMYNEALEQAKKELATCGSMDCEAARLIFRLFPQLRESEDEMIKKTIRQLLETARDAHSNTSLAKPFIDALAWLEKQKENLKSSDSIPSDCTSDAKCEDRWHKVKDSLPNSTREVLCKDAIGNFFIGRYYKSTQSWEVVMYDDCDKSNEDNPPVVKWCEIPSEKQKEQKPIKMEVCEVGKGTTICGQDYKCKKDYKEGNCRYIKDAIYHCGRDGYLTDQNGISWSCTPEWFNEYIQSNTERAEEEKTRFVSGQFLQCKLSFDGFQEGEHYWLEYVGDDMYVGRSDNILNQKFHITPRQLFTLFSQELEEVQGPPQEEKPVSLNYEPPFNENPSDNEIIEALIKDLKEQDGFLTAINCVSTKAILSWLKKQKEQKSIRWTELTWKDINELERIINNVHYEFQNGIGEDSFGELVLERFKEYKDDGSMDEQKPAECERQPEFKEVEYDFRGEKVKVMRPFFRDDKGREFSTTGQDTDLTWSVLREWCEIKGIIPYDLYPRAEWSEEDEEMLDIVLTMVDCSTVVPHSGGQLHPSDNYKKDISNWLKSLRPQPKIEKIEWDSHDKAIVGCIAVCLDGQFVTEAARKQCLEWFNKHRIDFLNSTSWKPTEVQMDALEAATVRYQSTGLESLYEELKKLM